MGERERAASTEMVNILGSGRSIRSYTPSDIIVMSPPRVAEPTGTKRRPKETEKSKGKKTKKKKKKKNNHNNKSYPGD